MFLIAYKGAASKPLAEGGFRAKKAFDGSNERSGLYGVDELCVGDWMHGVWFLDTGEIGQLRRGPCTYHNDEVPLNQHVFTTRMHFGGRLPSFGDSPNLEVGEAVLAVYDAAQS